MVALDSRLPALIIRRDAREVRRGHPGDESLVADQTREANEVPLVQSMPRWMKLNPDLGRGPDGEAGSMRTQVELSSLLGIKEANRFACRVDDRLLADDPLGPPV
jgi:hypothetical protein